jgi:hypothetical protein
MMKNKIFKDNSIKELNLKLSKSLFFFYISFTIQNYFYLRKISVTGREEQHLQTNKAALDEVNDKYRQ